MELQLLLLLLLSCFNHVWLSATPWTAAHQAPPSMGFSRQEYWSGVPLPSGITVELFQILKDDAVKVLHSICQQIWKTQHWPQECKRSVFIPIPKKVKVKVKLLSRVWLLVTPWTAGYQAPPSMGFSRQKYWMGCHCLLQSQSKAMPKNAQTTAQLHPSHTLVK